MYFYVSNITSKSSRWTLSITQSLKFSTQIPLCTAKEVIFSCYGRKYTDKWFKQNVNFLKHSCPKTSVIKFSISIQSYRGKFNFSGNWILYWNIDNVLVDNKTLFNFPLNFLYLGIFSKVIVKFEQILSNQHYFHQWCVDIFPLGENLRQIKPRSVRNLLSTQRK